MVLQSKSGLSWLYSLGNTVYHESHSLGEHERLCDQISVAKGHDILGDILVMIGTGDDKLVEAVFQRRGLVWRGICTG